MDKEIEELQKIVAELIAEDYPDYNYVLIIHVRGTPGVALDSNLTKETTKEFLKKIAELPLSRMQ